METPVCITVIGYVLFLFFLLYCACAVHHQLYLYNLHDGARSSKREIAGKPSAALAALTNLLLPLTPTYTQFSFAAGMWEILCARPEVRILLAGPTGSGKTTLVRRAKLCVQAVKNLISLHKTSHGVLYVMRCRASS